jgi:predicted transcriptional regulator
MIRLGEAMMILELHRQGLSVTAIARRTGRDPKTVRKYIERGVEAPAYGPRRIGRPCKIAPLGWEHISLTGDYRWNVESRPDPGQLRPLRTPSSLLAA